MPRTYYCRKCGDTHDPPTGKQCQRERQQDGPAQTTGLFELLSKVSQKISDIDDRVRNIEVDRRSTHEEPRSPDTDSLQGAQAPREMAEPAVSPRTLRKDTQLMRQAANRLARLQLDDSGDEDFLNIRTPRANGKKSGSLMTAAEKVERIIDWPHMYVRRSTGGQRKPVSYSDLRVEEFVFGFLSMIDSPKCKWDYRVMTQILKHMMQDTMDFSWANVLNFYQMAGLEVEYGTIEWSDSDVIREIRSTYARTVFPVKKENKEQQQQRPAPQTAPSNMKTCVAFQKATCEHDKDHPPYTHACAYCHKTKSLICRHNESDCYRKINDSKNGRQRES